MDPIITNMMTVLKSDHNFYETEGWEIGRRESRTLTTIFGELDFSRRRMHKTSKNP